jgi:hypothetical protein
MRGAYPLGVPPNERYDGVGELSEGKRLGDIAGQRPIDTRRQPKLPPAALWAETDVAATLLASAAADAAGADVDSTLVTDATAAA